MHCNGLSDKKSGRNGVLTSHALQWNFQIEMYIINDVTRNVILFLNGNPNGNSKWNSLQIKILTEFLNVTPNGILNGTPNGILNGTPNGILNGTPNAEPNLSEWP